MARRKKNFSFSASEAGTAGKPDKTADLLGLEGGASETGGAGGLGLRLAALARTLTG